MDEGSRMSDMIDAWLKNKKGSPVCRESPCSKSEGGSRRQVRGVNDHQKYTRAHRSDEDAEIVSACAITTALYHTV